MSDSNDKFKAYTPLSINKLKATKIEVKYDEGNLNETKTSS